MGVRVMNRVFFATTLLMCLVGLTACNSGTTYGTGVSHEKQTLDGFYNMIALKPQKEPKIDYSSRPDLVMPANQDALPEPGEATANAPQNWPVSPEQRIAAVREDAPTIDGQTGLMENRENLNQLATPSRKKRKYEHENDVLTVRSVVNEVNKSRQIDKDIIKYSAPTSRKYLTEPPTEYRTPTATAEAGDLGHDSEYLKKLRKKKRAEMLAETKGLPSPD